MQGKSKLHSVLGHALVDAIDLVKLLRVGALTVIWTTNVVMSNAAELLQPLRLLFLKDGPFLEKGGEILSNIQLRCRCWRRHRMHTLAEAILCFRRFKRVLTPICEELARHPSKTTTSSYLGLKDVVNSWRGDGGLSLGGRRGRGSQNDRVLIEVSIDRSAGLGCLHRLNGLDGLGVGRVHMLGRMRGQTNLAFIGFDERRWSQVVVHGEMLLVGHDDG